MPTLVGFRLTRFIFNLLKIVFWNQFEVSMPPVILPNRLLAAVGSSPFFIDPDFCLEVVNDLNRRDRSIFFRVL